MNENVDKNSNESKTNSSPTIVERRRGRRMFCWNAAFWGLGNGLVGSSLVVYIILSLAASSTDKARIGIAIAWILAAPRLIGLLRILTPCLIDAVGSRRIVCFVGYIVSPLILLALTVLVPVLSEWDSLYIDRALWIVGLVWAFYHLIEYFATVSLWSWIGDFVPLRIRVRFLAKRERWMIAGQFAGMLFAGLYSYGAIYSDPPLNVAERWRVYLKLAELGVFFLTLAAVPILAIPEIAWKKVSTFADRVRELVAPFRSPVLTKFVVFGCWIQIANGLTQSPQSIFQTSVLNVSMLTALALGSWTRIGQMFLSGSVGKWIDRFGVRRTMIVSLLIVASGPLFYLIATPSSWFWIFFAATVWIGWIGVNLGINHLTISLASPERRASFIALYFMATTLAFGVATLVGGWLFDRFKTFSCRLPFDGGTLDYFQIAFLIGCLLRCLGIVFLLRSSKKNDSVLVSSERIFDE